MPEVQAQPLDDTEVRARVTAGALALDDYLGQNEWEHNVDLGKLRIIDIRDCVLGQLFGDYFHGGMELFGDVDAYGNAYLADSPGHYGFARITDHPQENEALFVAWHTEIQARLAALKEGTPTNVAE